MAMTTMRAATPTVLLVRVFIWDHSLSSILSPSLFMLLRATQWRAEKMSPGEAQEQHLVHANGGLKGQTV